MEFEFERRRVTKEDIRELIFREILEYHPQLLKDYVNGTERTTFLYPRLYHCTVEHIHDAFAHSCIFCISCINFYHSTTWRTYSHVLVYAVLSTNLGSNLLILKKIAETALWFQWKENILLFLGNLWSSYYVVCTLHCVTCILTWHGQNHFEYSWWDL